MNRLALPADSPVGENVNPGGSSRDRASTLACATAATIAASGFGSMPGVRVVGAVRRAVLELAGAAGAPVISTHSTVRVADDPSRRSAWRSSI